MNLAVALLMCPTPFKSHCSSKWGFTAPLKASTGCLGPRAPYNHVQVGACSVVLVAHQRHVVMAAWQGMNVRAAVRNKSFICNCMRPRCWKTYTMEAPR